MGSRGFPKVGIPFWGVPIIRTIVSWGRYLFRETTILWFWVYGLRGSHRAYGFGGLGYRVHGSSLIAVQPSVMQNPEGPSTQAWV